MRSRNSGIAADRRTPSAAAGSGSWGCYLLRCADDTLYAGATNDIVRRLAAHLTGRGARYTRSRLPVELAYWQDCADRSSALREEARLKRLSRAAKIALTESWAAAARTAARSRSARTRRVLARGTGKTVK